MTSSTFKSGRKKGNKLTYTYTCVHTHTHGKVRKLIEKSRQHDNSEPEDTASWDKDYATIQKNLGKTKRNRTIT